ncbi:uncharacterized protein LOC134943896 [Pseudophryne corroboree]|uniref:uncharacterized protein LOC134943896 n=1 Tax=Pseudophryne corroboree TaxID=495146 RepID=UPI003081BFCD
MSDYIKDFLLTDCELGDQGYQRVLLQLYGLPGNGKSSFINSCKFVLDGGEFTVQAEAADSYGGFTKHRKPYKLTDTLWMVDNRGMSKLDGFQTGEIFAQLVNLLPLDEKVEWCEDFNKNVARLLGEHKKNNYKDFIVPVFIHSACNKLKTEDLPVYRELLHKSTDLTGIEPFIVLTHKSNGGLESMRNVFKDMGMEKIYALENYTTKDHQEVREKHEEIINILTKVVADVIFRMRFKSDPTNESYNHLQFLLEYMKTSADRKRGEEIERKMAEAQRNAKKSSCPLL